MTAKARAPSRPEPSRLPGVKMAAEGGAREGRARSRSPRARPFAAGR